MSYLIPQESLPACLRNLPLYAKDAIEFSLSTDDTSTDAQLIKQWGIDVALHEHIGAEAVKFREHFIDKRDCVMFPELQVEQDDEDDCPRERQSA